MSYTNIVEVYDSPMLKNKTNHFTSIKSFLNWQEKSAPDLLADCIAINGYILLSWDEIDNFVGLDYNPTFKNCV